MGHHINKKNKTVYYKDGNQIEVLPHADLASFEIIDTWYKYNKYAKDKNHVYFRENIIEDADPETFRIDIDPKNIPLGYTYSKDKDHVYHYGKKLKKLSPEELVFHSWDIISDKKYVYYFGHLLEGADVKSYKYLEDDWSIDKSHVWKHHLLVKGADPETFQIIDSRYAKDKHTVYFGYDAIPLEGCNPKTIEILNFDYMKDDKHVYLDGKIIAGAHAESFVILDGKVTKDAFHVFHQHAIVPEADASSFQPIGADWMDNKQKFIFGYNTYTIEPLVETNTDIITIQHHTTAFLNTSNEVLVEDFLKEFKANPDIIPLRPALVIPLTDDSKEKAVMEERKYLESHPSSEEVLQTLYAQEQTKETYFGGFPVMLPGEKWPTHPKTGKALTFIGQIINNELSKEFMGKIQMIRIFMDFSEEDEWDLSTAFRYTQQIITCNPIAEFIKPSFEEFKKLQATDSVYTIIHQRYTHAPVKVLSITSSLVREYIEAKYSILEAPIALSDITHTARLHDLYKKQQEKKEELEQLFYDHLLQLSPLIRDTSFDICIQGYAFFAQDDTWALEKENGEVLPFFMHLDESILMYGTTQYALDHYLYVDPEHPEYGSEMMYQST